MLDFQLNETSFESIYSVEPLENNKVSASSSSDPRRLSRLSNCYNKEY